jgi:hypothetical protein
VFDADNRTVGHMVHDDAGQRPQGEGTPDAI